MLAVTSVIAEKCVSICFSTFLNIAELGVRGNFLTTLSFDGLGYVNNVLMNALKINALTALVLMYFQFLIHSKL